MEITERAGTGIRHENSWPQSPAVKTLKILCIGLKNCA